MENWCNWRNIGKEQGVRARGQSRGVKGVRARGQSRGSGQGVRAGGRG